MATVNEAPLDPRVQLLLDRQEILDCIHRYTRGVDRLDEQLLRSAFHPDATDDHGTFRGTADEFVTWAFGVHGTRHHGHHHYVTNHTCEVAGDVAHSETYFVMVAQNVDGTPVTLHGGRYLDQHERREGVWRILHRVSMLEWVGGVIPPDLPSVVREPNGIVARDRTDTSYDRPLLSVARRT